MENAADALKMAAAVLIFVLAISITILSFGQVRDAADTILNYRDRETDYLETDYYYGTTETTRTVSLETVIPSIFRAFLENYKIVFDFQNGDNEPLYYIKENAKDPTPRYSLDLETNSTETNAVLAGNERKAEFIRAILFRDKVANFDDIFITIKLEGRSLYDRLKGKTITEALGVYYEEDDPNVPDVMKTEKRVITYTIK